MPDYLDRSETRTPQSREVALFRNLRGMISVARPRAAALRKQVRGIDLSSLRNRADLAQIPIVRRSNLQRLQSEDLPFGGLTSARTGTLKHVLMTPDSAFVPEGHAKDWWGAARALYAAGFRKGDLVINCFSYHLSPGGHMMETGAQALGCAVIPAGTAHIDHQLEAIAQLKPLAYMGPADFLKLLLDRALEASVDVSSIRTAMVSGRFVDPVLCADLSMRIGRVQHCYATPELGVIAYQTRLDAGTLIDGMVVNENVIIEIVRPGTDELLAPGETGEIVVTRLNADYPLLRFATGDVSAIISGTSPCGRTNTRIKCPQGGVDHIAIQQGHVLSRQQMLAAMHGLPGISRLRLVVSRAENQDRIVVHVESPEPTAGLTQTLREKLAILVRCETDVRFVALGSLPDDGLMLVDERPLY